jgi:ABC-type uncharacterized transport system ATPase subunit
VIALRVVSPIALRVERGEVVGFLGVTGAGTSTTTRQWVAADGLDSAPCRVRWSAGVHSLVPAWRE